MIHQGFCIFLSGFHDSVFFHRRYVSLCIQISKYAQNILTTDHNRSVLYVYRYTSVPALPAAKQDTAARTRASKSCDDCRMDSSSVIGPLHSEKIPAAPMS